MKSKIIQYPIIKPAYKILPDVFSWITKKSKLYFFGSLSESNLLKSFDNANNVTRHIANERSGPNKNDDMIMQDIFGALNY